MPRPLDYDGDNKADFVVWRPSDGVWYLRLSSSQYFAIQHGATTDKPVHPVLQ